MSKGDLLKQYIALQDDLNEIDQETLTKTAGYWFSRISNRVAHLIFSAEYQRRDTPAEGYDVNGC